MIVSRVFSYRVPDSVAPYLYFVGNTMSFLPPKNNTHNITHTMPQSANSTNSETVGHRRQTQIDSQSAVWQSARVDTRRWLMSHCTCISTSCSLLLQCVPLWLTICDSRAPNSWGSQSAGAGPLEAPCYGSGGTTDRCFCVPALVPSRKGLQNYCNLVTPEVMRSVYSISSDSVSLTNLWPEHRNRSASQGVFGQSSYAEPNYYSNEDLAVYGRMPGQVDQSPSPTTSHSA